MEFTLITELSGLALKDWLLMAALIAVAAVCALLLKKFSAQPQKALDTRSLVYGALCVSLSFVLSYLKLFEMPQGGSITPASMLPVMLYAYWFGPRKGFMAAFVYSLLQFIQAPYFLSFFQFLLDYVISFTALGLVGFFAPGEKSSAGWKKASLVVGVLVGGLARFLSNFAAGVIYYGSYAPEGMNPVLYSLTYQLASIGPDVIICAIVAAILMYSGILNRLDPTKRIYA
jgi:thiamine transporter